MRVNKTYDNLLILKDAGALTSSGACQVGGSAKVLDLAGAGFSSEVPATEGDIVIDVTACEIDSDDEKYTIGAQISDSLTFSSGIYQVAQLELGAAGSMAGDNLAGDSDMEIGRWKLGFSNRIADGVTKRYMRLYVTIGGTIVTGINFSAYLAKK